MEKPNFLVSSKKLLKLRIYGKTYLLSKLFVPVLKNKVFVFVLFVFCFCLFVCLFFFQIENMKMQVLM